jgi:hypothetical protein
MTEQPASLKKKTSEFLAEVQAKSADGLTVGELAGILFSAARLGITSVDKLKVPGTTKKEWVIDVVALTFVQLADKLVPALLWPIWALAKPLTVHLLRQVTGGVIEVLLPLVRRRPA